MPEGDTVRRLANRISGAFAGETIERSALRDPRLAGVDLAGRRLAGADAYGKHLFVRFDDGRSLHAHLLMTGSFEIGRPSTVPDWKRRVELWLPSGRLTAVEVPRLGFVATAAEHEIIDRLGPDLCAPALAPDPGVIAARMLESPGDPLSGAMLDQRNAAGFGNVYANDVPFIVGAGPSQPVGTIDGLPDLVAIGVALIRTNAERGPQNTTGRRLATDARWVHGVGRRPCPVCGCRLHHLPATSTGWGRSITWCPECQPLDDRRTVDLDRARRLIALHPAVRQDVFPRQI